MTDPTYADLGWTAHFARQADASAIHPLRIAEVHRNRVTAAIADGTLDDDRLRRWRKLRAEDRRNSESVAEARARRKSFGKMVKGAMQQKSRDKSG